MLLLFIFFQHMLNLLPPLFFCSSLLIFFFQESNFILHFSLKNLASEDSRMLDLERTLDFIQSIPFNQQIGKPGSWKLLFIQLTRKAELDPLCLQCCLHYTTTFTFHFDRQLLLNAFFPPYILNTVEQVFVLQVFHLLFMFLKQFKRRAASSRATVFACLFFFLNCFPNVAAVFFTQL